MGLQHISQVVCDMYKIKTLSLKDFWNKIMQIHVYIENISEFLLNKLWQEFYI